MKKIFTLIAGLMLAFSASADAWVVPAEAPEAGTVIVDNDLIKASTVYATGVSADEVTLAGQEFTHRMNVRVAAWPSASDLNGTDNGGSTPIVIEVKKPLEITFAFRRQYKDGYNAGDGKDMALFSHPDATRLAGEMVEVNDLDGSYGNCTEKFSLSVGTYTLAAKGTTLGLFGFVYEAVGGDTPEPAEGETMSVFGNGSGIFNKEFESYVVPFAFNIADNQLTLKNFLGGETTVVLDFKLHASTMKPNEVGTLYDAIAVSGLGEEELIQSYYHMCPINDFNGSFILKQNGVNVGKLDNIKLAVGGATNYEIKKDTSDGPVYYLFTIFFGGDYSKWNAETNAWDASGSNYVRFEYKYIPSGSSSIDEVAVDFDENAPVEYYNLQGVRVAEPSNGVFIKRQGNKVVKVLVK